MRYSPAFLVVYFLPFHEKVFFPAARLALKALLKEPLSMPPCVRREGTLGPWRGL